MLYAVRAPPDATAPFRLRSSDAEAENFRSTFLTDLQELTEDTMQLTRPVRNSPAFLI